MTSDPHRLAVAVEEAVQHLARKLTLLGALDPEAAARDFIDWQRRQGWRPWAVPTVLPRDHTRPADPSRVTAMADEVRSVIRQKRASAPTDAEEQQ